MTKKANNKGVLELSKKTRNSISDYFGGGVFNVEYELYEVKNGKNIYPEELETLVNNIEGVKESFVYGKPEDDGDYKICAKIVYDKDTIEGIYGTKDEKELQELIWKEIKKVNKTMPTYKYIKEINITDKDLIKTTTQKIKRFEEIKTVL